MDKVVGIRLPPTEVDMTILLTARQLLGHMDNLTHMLNSTIQVCWNLLIMVCLIFFYVICY